MSVLVGPVAIVAAGPVQVETPARQPGEFSHVVLDNATPYVLTIQTGGNGRAIPPFTSDVVQLDTSSLFLTVLASQVPGGPVSTPQSYLESTFYTDDDELPSGLPTPLTSQLIQATLAAGSQVALAPGAAVGLQQGAQLTDALGNPMQPVQVAVASSFFGNGLDGTATISANTTLTSIKQYAALTVNATVTLQLGGFPVLVQTTLTNNGTIAADGSNGTNGTASVAGVGGAGAPGGMYPAGTTGGNGSGSAGSPAANLTNANLATVGGRGGSGAGGNLGSGGAAGTLPALTGGLPAMDSTIAQLLHGPGTGGGGGGGSSTWTGAGGGGGAGVVVICANNVTTTAAGVFRALGGNGGAAASNAGGGGGGGGGQIVVCYVTRTVAGISYSVPGGTHGASGNPAAVDGNAGAVYLIPVKVAA